MKKLLSIIFCLIFVIACKNESTILSEEKQEFLNKTANSLSDEKKESTKNLSDCLTLTEFSKYWKNEKQPLKNVSLCLYKQGISSRVPYVFEGMESQLVLTKYGMKAEGSIESATFNVKIHHETGTHIFYELFSKEDVHFISPTSFFFEYDKRKKYNQLVVTIPRPNFKTIHFDENILVGYIRIHGGIFLYNRSLNSWYSLNLAGTAEFECDTETKSCFATDQDLYCRIDDETICDYRRKPPRYEKEKYKLMEIDPNRANFVSFYWGNEHFSPTNKRWEKQFKHKYPIVMKLEDMIKTTQMETPVFHLGHDRYFMKQINVGEYVPVKIEEGVHF